jgi:hypothetical protein
MVLTYPAKGAGYSGGKQILYPADPEALPYLSPPEKYC